MHEKLAGTLPPEMSRMTSLALLDLRHNKISGKIPQLFGRLTNLQQLWLQDNQLTGERKGREKLKRCVYGICDMYPDFRQAGAREVVKRRIIAPVRKLVEV